MISWKLLGAGIGEVRSGGVARSLVTPARAVNQPRQNAAVKST